MVFHYSHVKWESGHQNSLASGLLAQQFVQAAIKGNIKAKHHWPLEWGIHRWSVDSPHKGPVTRKACPYHGVIMQCALCRGRLFLLPTLKDIIIWHVLWHHSMGLLNWFNIIHVHVVMLLGTISHISQSVYLIWVMWQVGENIFHTNCKISDNIFRLNTTFLKLKPKYCEYTESITGVTDRLEEDILNNLIIHHIVVVNKYKIPCVRFYTSDNRYETMFIWTSFCFNFNCSFMLIVSCRLMIRNYHIYAVVVADVDFKVETLQWINSR